ncbi:MAG: ribonuclease III [Steroidobacteraceae bacterium]
MKTLTQWLQDTFAYSCRDLSLFETALTHRSVGSAHNERLEFLGDAVLNNVTASLLYHTFTTASEGELSRYRATLVSGESLAALAVQYQIGERLRLGQGELKSGGFRRKSILADTLEALLGAVYLDSGFGAATAVIERMFVDRLQQLPQAAQLKDPKTQLQEALQARSIAIPDYLVEAITGEPHEQHFQVSCLVPSLKLQAQGQGSSRRAAEQVAAEQVLFQLKALWSK